MELTPHSIKKTKVPPPKISLFEFRVPLHKLLSSLLSIFRSSSQKPKEPRGKKQVLINVLVFRNSIEAWKDTLIQEELEIWEPVTPASPTSTPQKVKTKLASAESVLEDIVTAE